MSAAGVKRLPYFPMLVDLSERYVLVAAQGEEALHLTRLFAQYSRHVVLLTEGDCGGDLPPGTEVLRKAYAREDLYGMDYVVAASPDERVNEDIYITCRTLGIRVHTVSDPDRCDFFLPGTERKQHA